MTVIFKDLILESLRRGKGRFDLEERLNIQSKRLMPDGCVEELQCKSWRDEMLSQRD